MNKEELLKNWRRQILQVAAIHGAKYVLVFGSVARNEAGSASDIDLLVQLESGRSLLDIIAIKQDLEDLLGYKVDVVTEASLSPYIREQVLKEAAQSMKSDVMYLRHILDAVEKKELENDESQFD